MIITKRAGLKPITLILIVLISFHLHSLLGREQHSKGTQLECVVWIQS